jgi:excisionase family DNA binding protein
MAGGNFVKNFLRFDEVAEMLGVHERTVRRWGESGTTCLQIVQFGARSQRITMESLTTFCQVSGKNLHDE